MKRGGPLRRSGPLKRTGTKRARSAVRSNPMPPGRWDEVAARDRTCRAWSVGFATDAHCWGREHVHHRVLKGMGGTPDPAIHDADNLMLLCERHHDLAHNTRRSEAEAAGVIIRKTNP